jgi:hypothetical protein
MLLRTTMALALILASASGSLAAQNQKKHSNDAYRAFASSPQVAQTQQHSTNPGYDVYNTRGRYVGSDPDPVVGAPRGRAAGGDSRPSRR